MLDLQQEVATLWPVLEPALQRVLRSGQFIGGEELQALEDDLAAYLGVKHAVGLNSGTDALMIGLRSLGIGAGDEVLTPSFSFFASAEAISNVGARPVFVDVNPLDFTLEPSLLAQHLSPRSKAIMPVHLFGQAAAMGQIMAFAAEHKLAVIEDCAQSFGTRYAADCPACSSDFCPPWQGRYTGSIGAVGAFSFYPTKNLGAYGDAGLLTCHDDEVAAYARMLRSHGEKQRYAHELLGYNSRLDSLQAAVLRVKLPYVAQWNEARRQHAAYYQRGLESEAQAGKLQLPRLSPSHSVHQYTLRIFANRRDAVKEQLAAQGIASAVYYPLPQECNPAYAQHQQLHANPVSAQLCREVLSLPVHPFLSLEALERVVQAVKQALA